MNGKLSFLGKWSRKLFRGERGRAGARRAAGRPAGRVIVDAVRPVVAEMLEERRMLTVTYDALNDRVDIVGSNVADTYTLSEVVTTSGATLFRVVENGVTFDFDTATQPVTNVDAVLLDGWDVLTMQAGLSQTLVADAGLGVDVIFAAKGNDTIYGNEGNDIIYGRQGNDRIWGSSGIDSIVGGEGDDRIYGESDDDILKGEAGKDYISGGNDSDDEIYGGTEDDELHGDEGNDTCYGGDGNDDVFGETGEDSLFGGIGDDSIRGNDGVDTLYGGDGIDTLHGDAHTDYVYGLADTDYVYGDANDDWVYGDGGNDFVYGGAGDDRVIGGDDNDIVYGSSGLDTLFGYGGNDVLNGEGNADSLYGGDNEDVLYGGDAGDSLFGEAGNDQLDGEDGNDTLQGDGDSDTLNGGEGADSLLGSDGDDLLRGHAGDDTLQGEADNDSLYAGDGDDSVMGGDGRDGVYGGRGMDTLEGNGGNDRFLNFYTNGFLGFKNWEDDDSERTNDDALVGLEDGSQGSSGDFDYTGGSWTDDELEQADVGLAILHHATGNKALLETNAGNHIELVRHDSITSGQLNPAFNDGRGKMRFFDNAFTDAQGIEQIVIHEIGHNFDDEYDKNGWEALSGWTRSNNSPGADFVASGEVGDDWWFDGTAAGFVSDYAKDNPLEDFAESFQAFFSALGGLTFVGDNAVAISTIPDKENFFEQMVIDLS